MYPVLDLFCFQRVCEVDGNPSILERVRDATITLQAVLSGKHDEEVQLALREVGVEESTWWTALRKVIQGELNWRTCVSHLLGSFPNLSM